MEHIDSKLIDIALERVAGSVFENFANAMLSAIIGSDFIPLGGTHDGGADGFVDSSLSEGSGAPTTFVQISTQADHLSKIRKTVARLREYGREPKIIHYVTSRTVRALDKVQSDLTQELGVSIFIRDSVWIRTNINFSDRTISAFRTYLYPDLRFLQAPGGTSIIQDSPNIKDARTVCVFLRQEVDRRSGRGDLIETVVDSLLLWALEGTDPEADKLMSRKEIAEKVNAILPITSIVTTDFASKRLELLSSKKNPVGREVRWYKNDDMFCLPFETRKQVEQENIEDEALRIRVNENFENRAQSVDSGVSPSDVAKVALSSIQMTFEAHGLALAAFLENKEGDSGYEALTISDQVDKVLVSGAVKATSSEIKRVVMAVIRQALYDSREDERLYFGKLARTYSLFLILKADPKVVEYFRSMSAQLTLFVGTDILVRSLSERYLKPDNQMTCNLLSILRDFGAELVLAQPTLDEIYAHLATTDREFEDRYRGIESSVSLEIVEHEPRILIRAYLYAKLNTLEGVRSPNNWRHFMEQICSYDDLRDNQRGRKGKELVMRYLTEKFGLRYMKMEDMEVVTSRDEVEQLADKIEDVRAGRARVLAKNDALMVLAVYGTRTKQGEDQMNNPYGYRTWWLTSESRVVHATMDVVHRYGARYIIRPDFLLQYVAFAPSADDVRRSYKRVFPTLLGIKLSNRIDDKRFNTLMREAREVADVDDARARVMLGQLADRLKSNSVQ